MPPPVVAIIGTGLIGGSLGMSLRLKKTARVLGVERNPESAAEAVRVGAVDAVLPLADAVAQASVVVVATPVGPAMEHILREVASVAGPGTIVTDTGSTKVEVHEAARRAGFRPGVVFIGGHPFSGSENSGIRAADPYLFQNAFYLLTTDQSVDQTALDRLTALLSVTGAVTHRLSPEQHDRLAATISHLPHAVAAALVNAAVRITGEGEEFLRFAAGGFRDTTRVAAGDPALWREILLSNRPPLLAALAALDEEFACLRSALMQADGTALTAWLTAARDHRRTVPRRRTGMLVPLHELVVQVEDRPGVIARVTALLAEAAINLREIEILRLREGEGGVLLIGVDSEAALQMSLSLLAGAGFTARPRSE